MNNNLSLQDYLKKYSTINNKFIEDFFSLYSVNTSDNDFIINLDNVAKWLNTLKKVLKTTLKDSYQENVDYTVKTLPPQGKGRPIEEIMLSPSCFKRLSMMSRTVKAEEVRNYFLQIEAHLDKYKNHIINALNKKISKYETELKPQPIMPIGGVIYVLKTTEEIEGVFKIGRTQDFKARLKTHQSSHPDKLDVVFVYESDNVEKVESCLKDALKDKAYRKRKEFYEIDGQILKHLIEQCECMHMIIRKQAKQIKDINCKYIIHFTKKSLTSKIHKKILLDKL
jgi:phage anti-repressor protein/predicted GIY-YIG superfamily endonuclease